MSDRCRLLAAFVRGLPDDDLNDLLVELPKDRFCALLDAALTDSELSAQAGPERAA
jgi:hypothetical protein